MSIPEVLVVDTHPLVWHVTGHTRRLSKTARRVFDGVEQGAVSLLMPSVVLMEMWFLTLNGTMETLPTFRAWWRGHARENLIEVPLEHEDVLQAADLRWSHRDPHDRLIVATAVRLGCPLLTADQAITEWGGVDIVW